MAGIGLNWSQETGARVLGCGTQLVNAGESVRVAFANLDSGPARFVGQQVPDASAARDREQAGLPLGELAAVTQEGEHRLRVRAGNPLGRVHRITSRLPE